MKRVRIIKRITAAGMAVSLFLTGSWTGHPIQAYAGPISPTADVLLPPETAGQGEEAPEQGLSAILGGVEKYFMSLRGNSRVGSDIVIPGLSLAEKTTSLTFPATNGTYYLVIPSGSGQTVTAPASHEAALNAGWIRKLGTDGSFVWTGLAWNTSYDVYGTDLSSVTTLGEDILTRKGKAGGTILIEGDLLTGGSITASLDDTAPTKEGTWSWYYGNTAGGGADSWTALVAAQPTGELTIPGPEVAGGQYLKAVFTTSGDYEGSVEQVSESRVASRLNQVMITGTPAIGEVLEAAADPAACEPGVQYTWYRQADSSGQTDADILVYTGKNYTIQADDIGKKLYVKATSLADSVSVGNTVSASTDPVIARQASAASVPEITEKTDTAVTVKQPEGSTGLYQFAWSTTPDWNPATDSYTVFDTKTRDTTPVTIQGLSPSTGYYIRARHIGENGWLDSDWGSAVQVSTLAPALKGSLILSGSCVYGQTLQASLDTSGQAGSFHWYRTEAGSGDAGTEITAAAGQSSYTLGEDDIAHQIRVIYQGDGITTSGEMNILSDIVEKAVQEAPVIADLGEISVTDSSLAFTVPTSLSHVMIGYSETENGVPEQAASGRIYNGGDQVEITGLDRNTEYHLFLKYAQTNTHKESNWTSSVTSRTTSKTNLNTIGCTIIFSPGNPAPGDTLIAELSGIPGGEGTWIWTERQPGSGDRQIGFRQDVDQPLQTSYPIPSDRADGTVYLVTFTGEGGFEGQITQSSEPLKTAEKEPYPTPNPPALVTTGDTTLTVAMEGVTSGIYSFSYSDDPNAAEVSRTQVAGRYYGGSSAVITGLDRNHTYYVWAKQNVSEDHKESDWSAASAGYTTEKTWIGGYVKLTGEAMYGHTLTASYVGASYMPEGDDSQGEWKWYRGEVPAAISFQINGATPVAAEPVYTLIEGVIEADYTLGEDDIGCYIKAQYSGTGDFQGTKEAASQIIQKAAQTAPEAGVLSPSENTAADQVSMTIQLDAGSYYQVRESRDEVPSAPESPEAAAAAGWRKVDGAVVTVTVCYSAGAEEALKPNTDYTVYSVLPGTGLLQPSTVVKGNTAGSSQYKQTGTIRYQSVKDPSGVQIVVGGEVEAILEAANSVKGTWKWYVSAKDYQSFYESEEGAWTQVISGYQPTADSETSRLTLTEEMLGHYIRAEFTADPQTGYAGTIDATAKGNRYYGNHVKKIYKETITLESSASDGYGNPAAYEYSVLTVTVNDYAEKGGLIANRRSLKLKIGADDSGLTAVQDPDHENKVTFTLPATNKNWDQKRLTAEISLPKDPDLYVDEKMAALTISTITSLTEADSGILYKYGVSINNKDDLVNFLLRSGTYSGWSSDLYIITSDIQYPESGGVLAISATFSRILDGDYHTVSGLLNPLFQTISGGAVRNLILNRTNVDRPDQGASHEENIGATIALHAEGDMILQRVFLSQATVDGGHDVGYFLGKVTAEKAQISIDQCASSGGLITTKEADRVVGGFMGYTGKGTVRISNAIAVGTEIRASRKNVGGGLGVVGGDGNFAPTICSNVVVASKVVGDFQKYKSGGALGIYSGNAGGETQITTHAVYYDSTLTPDASFYEYAAGKDCSKYKGVPKPTKELISSEVKDEFDKNISGGSDSIWTYEEGFYPRLNWIADDPICALFSATRGAFTSMDGSTSPDDMFEGNISGPIEIPLELQREGYSFSAEGSLTADQSGMVIPTEVGSGKVTISYADDLTSAENTYEFNVVDTTSLKKNFQSVTIENGDAAKIGMNLSAKVTFESGDTDTPGESAITYTWYRRKNGELIKEKISAASGSTYEVQPEDAGSAIMVKAEAPGYWEMGSGYSALIEMTAPSLAPAVSVLDYQTVEITGQGGLLEKYEFAYEKDGGDLVIVPYEKTAPTTQTITGLSADTIYRFYSRIPAKEDGSMSSSAWSPAAEARTGLIPLEGEISMNGDANVEQTITAQMPDTNLQKGTWTAKWEKDGTSRNITAQLNRISDYRVEYTIQPGDVEGIITFTFTAGAPYGGTARTVKSAVIGPAIQLAPSAPTLSAVTDSQIYLTLYEDEDDPTNTAYEYGRKGPYDSGIQVLGATDAALSGNRVVIRNLTRNTSYEIYARKKAKTGYQTGNWSGALTAVTDQTEISSLKPVYSTQSMQVEGTVTVTAPSISGAAVTGEWKLERVDTLDSTKRATLNDYSISADGTSITYSLQPEDATYLLCATFVGNGDFKGSAVAMSEAEVQKKPYEAPSASDFIISSYNDSGVTVEVAAGKAGAYEFGYGTGGEVNACEGSIQQGTSFTITPLNRATVYKIYVRRQAETGYTRSGWSPAQEVKLEKTAINGAIQISGELAVGSSLTAAYEKGNYIAPDDSDEGGTYTWKLTSEAGAVTTRSGASYTVGVADRGSTVTVTYTPPESSKFTGTIEKMVGQVVKASVTDPAVPVVQAIADTQKGSTLRVTNAEVGVWYRVCLASETKPELVMEGQTAVDAGWIQAETGSLDISGLAVNQDYLVYGAKLETAGTAPSTLTVSAGIRTEKEELAAGLSVSQPVKPMTDTRTEIGTYGQAPDGSWYWYVSKDQGVADGWKLIRSSRAGKETAVSVDTYQIPYDYSGYYLKIIFQADGDYTGEKTWSSANAIAARQISGAVTILPSDPVLFSALTASYDGTDDQLGTWKWYREETGGGWSEIDDRLYGTVGITSSYTAGEADKGKALRAEYTAGSFGCEGSVSQTSGAISPASQNTPEAPKILQTIGTSVQLADSVPSQAKPYGERPEVVFGYRKMTEENLDEIQWNTPGEAWFRHLTPNSEYEFYTKYQATNVYTESSASSGVNQSIGNGTLSQANISLIYESGDDSRLDVGKKVQAVYSGEGYSEGSWKVSLSTGKELTGDQYTTETQPDPDGKSGKTVCTYVIDMNAISSTILFTYTADAANYTGMVTARTDRAVRKPVPATPEKPAVEQHQDTDFYLLGVKNTQEYALTTTAEAPGRYSGLWKILPEEEVDHTAGDRYIYTGLDRDTTYYVHTRVAETDTQEVSETMTSDPVTTLPYFGLGQLELKNEQDTLKQPKVERTIDMPETLELNGSLSLAAVTLKQEGSGGYEPAQVLEPYDSFAIAEGVNSPQVYESGSVWANDHYGTVLEVLDESGQIIGSNHENPEELAWTGRAAKLRLSLYRANAVTRGGTYIWEILLKDSGGNTALIHGEVEIITQLKATVPLQISLQILDQEIRQTTNGAGLKNSNGMPVEVSVDEKPRAGTGMPELWGEPVESDPQRMDPGAVYLKLSVDGSIETGQVTDLWLNTKLQSANIRPLIKLGASSQADYYISGIISENGTVDWPWPKDGSQTIQEAYGLKFVYEISADGYPVYTPKISSPDSITVLQEGGES